MQAPTGFDLADCCPTKSPVIDWAWERAPQQIVVWVIFCLVSYVKTSNGNLNVEVYENAVFLKNKFMNLSKNITTNMNSKYRIGYGNGAGDNYKDCFDDFRIYDKKE